MPGKTLAPCVHTPSVFNPYFSFSPSMDKTDVDCFSLPSVDHLRTKCGRNTRCSCVRDQTSLAKSRHKMAPLTLSLCLVDERQPA